MTSERDTGLATDPKRVAVVHGRDSRPKEAMFSFLRALRLNPVEWSQAIAATGKGTPYNKEAVAELFKDTQAVVVLMTGDDEAQLREQFRRADDDDFESELTPQPRPNVLIELGMAFGMMDARTIIAQVGKLRRMSDLEGLNVIRLSNSATTRKQLAARLKAAGCDLDDSGDDWLTVGDFTPTPPKRPKRKAKPPASSTGGGPRRENEDVPVVAPKSNVGEDFWLEPGAPAFRVDPGVDGATAETLKLLMTFAQTSGDEVTPVIEWSGANVEPSQPLMMPQNQPPGARYQKYQLKPALARPSAPNDEVTFDIRFRWQGATRQYCWSWPLYMREKGIWGMNNVAENTLEPMERTTLD